MTVYSVLPYDRNESGPQALEQEDQMGRGRIGGDGDEQGAVGPRRPLVGRGDEMQLIMGRASMLISGAGPGGAVVVEGNTGEGRTPVWSCSTQVRAGLRFGHAQHR